MDNLHRFVADFDGSIIFSVENEGLHETLQDLLGGIKLGTQLIQHLDQAQLTGLYMMVGACEHGFFDSMRNRALICESDLSAVASRIIAALSTPIR